MVIDNPKRSPNEKSGLFKWYPYYAGYSEKFVDSILNSFNSKKLVLDPWAGTGTTRLSCIKNGHPNIMVDINPVMMNFSAAKDYRVCRNKKWFKEQFYKVIDRILDSKPVTLRQNDPLLDYYPPNLAKIGRIYFDILPDCIDRNVKQIGLPKIKGNRTPVNPYRAFARVVFFRTARELIFDDISTKNPTWLKKNDTKKRIKNNKIIELLKLNFDNMIDDIGCSFLSSCKSANTINIVADTSKLDFGENIVDCVITSPPYLTRIDYAISTKPENLLLLESENKFEELRKTCLGTTMINGLPFSDSKYWGTLCNESLENIYNHNSYAAKTYYYPNIKQYFDKLFQSIQKLFLILAPGGQAFIVVQNSYFKNLNIDLAGIIIEMYKNLGAGTLILKEFPVRTYMAHMNRNASNNFKKKKIKESLIKIEKLR